MDFNLYFKSRQGEMVNLLKNIVGRESPSQDKRAVDACSALVVGEFKKIGARITRVAQKKTGDFFLAEYSGAARSPAWGQILILTHVDTVWPVGKISRMPFYISGDKVFGPGALDMKAGLVEVIFTLKALHQLNLKPAKKVAVFMNSAEEIGSEASHRLISELSRKSSIVLCLEPALPGGGLKTQRKGRAAVRLEVRGRAAHAGTPEKGINAVEELIVQLERLKRLATSGMTISVNQIGGGEKANIIAESAWAIMDIRFWSAAQKDKILKALKRLNPASPGAKFRFSLDSQTPPMEKTKASAQLFQKASKIAAAMDMQLTQGKTGGGSDASVASSLGLPTLDGLGPEGEGIHAENEHLLLSSLVKRTALLTEMLLQL